MNWAPPGQSLTARVTLAALAIFVVSIWLLAFIASRVLRQDMQVMLGAQQLSLASILAKEIDSALVDRLRALEAAQD